MYKTTLEHSATVASHLKLETTHSESISVVSEDALEFHHLECQVSPSSIPKALLNDTLIMTQKGR